jgi:hypothetical protein
VFKVPGHSALEFYYDVSSRPKEVTTTSDVKSQFVETIVAALFTVADHYSTIKILLQLPLFQGVQGQLPPRL